MQQDRFAIVPTEDELAALNREFNFVDLGVDSPRVLSAQQIKSFNRDGYLSPLDVFTPDEAGEIRQYFDQLLAATLAQGQDSYSISSAHLLYGPVHDLLCEPRIVRVVADLLGENVIGWGSHFFCKLPGDAKTVDWHQDASYWPLTPTRTLTVWLAIDDASLENACVRFIPGTHRQGRLAYEVDPVERRTNVLHQRIATPERFGEPVPNILRAGQISIHSDLLLHGSDANRSTQRRCGLTLRYCVPEVRAAMNWNQKGVHVAGSDPRGHWSNQPRPDKRLPV